MSKNMKQGSGRLAAGLFLSFPGAFRALGFRQIAVLHSIIRIAVTHGAKRLVVKAGGAGGFREFFRKLVNCLEMFGSGRNFSFGGL